MSDVSAFGPNHKVIERSEWDAGRARCHECDAVVDPRSAPMGLAGTEAKAGAETIRVFICPKCGESTHFHIRG
jgi:hypothetical protein